jgi:hypothetical protein
MQEQTEAEQVQATKPQYPKPGRAFSIWEFMLHRHCYGD